MIQCKQMPQSHFKIRSDQLIIISANIVDDVKVSGEKDNAKNSIDSFTC